MDVRLKKTVSWIAGTTSFSKPTAQDRDDYWRVMQHELTGGGEACGEVPLKYLAVTKRPTLSRHPKMAGLALPNSVARAASSVLNL